MAENPWGCRERIILLKKDKIVSLGTILNKQDKIILFKKDCP